MNKFLSLSFLPKSQDVTLLILRVGFGTYMLIFHGWGKLIGWSDKSGGFPDPLGVTSPVSLAFTGLAEVFVAAFLIVGLFTRLSAVILTSTMAVAFFMVHDGKFAGAGNGELAFVYGLAFLALIFSGGGRFSLDQKLGN